MSLSLGRKPGYSPRKPRYRVAFETTAMSADGASAPLLVRDLSDDGFMATTQASFAPGTSISVDLPDLGHVEAQIRWCEDGCIGAQFVKALPAFPRPEKLDRRSGRRSEYPKLKELREDFAARRSGKGAPKLKSVPSGPKPAATAAAKHEAPAPVQGERPQVPASLDTAAGRRNAVLFNLTTMGAMLEGSGLPQVGEDVSLKTHAVSVPGVVTWAGSGRCGVTFDRPIAEADVASHFGKGQSAKG